jgi:Domain of unknown function (DUF4351)
LNRIATSKENDDRRFLLVECLEAYANLDDVQTERLQALLHTEGYQQVETIMKTTFERGIEQGIERGIIQGEQRSTLRLMEAKFGPLSPTVKQQVGELSREALAQLQLDLLKAEALEELCLGE